MRLIWPTFNLLASTPLSPLSPSFLPSKECSLDQKKKTSHPTRLEKEISAITSMGQSLLGARRGSSSHKSASINIAWTHIYAYMEQSSFRSLQNISKTEKNKEKVKNTLTYIEAGTVQTNRPVKNIRIINHRLLCACTLNLIWANLLFFDWVRVLICL